MQKGSHGQRRNRMAIARYSGQNPEFRTDSASASAPICRRRPQPQDDRPIRAASTGRLRDRPNPQPVASRAPKQSHRGGAKPQNDGAVPTVRHGVAGAAEDDCLGPRIAAVSHLSGAPHTEPQ